MFYRILTASFISLVLVVTTGCEKTAAMPEFSLTETEWSYHGDEGWEMTTDHFILRTTLKDKHFREYIPGYLEACFAFYSELIPPPEITDNTTPPLNTWLFASRGQWERYVRETYPVRYPVLRKIRNGAFAERNNCIAYYIRRIYTLSVLAHEGFHQYLGGYFPETVPAWFNEGCATYCESVHLEQDIPVFTPQKNAFRINSLRKSLTAKRIIPLKELLATDAGKVIGSGHGAGTYYSQVWALTTFLRDGQEGKYRESFDALCSDLAKSQLHVKAGAAKLATGTPSEISYGEAVFRAYFTHDLDSIEKEYFDYMVSICGFSNPDHVDWNRNDHYR